MKWVERGILGKMLKADGMRNIILDVGRFKKRAGLNEVASVLLCSTPVSASASFPHIHHQQLCLYLFLAVSAQSPHLIPESPALHKSISAGPLQQSIGCMPVFFTQLGERSI